MARRRDGGGIGSGEKWEERTAKMAASTRTRPLRRPNSQDAIGILGPMHFLRPNHVSAQPSAQQQSKAQRERPSPSGDGPKNRVLCAVCCVLHGCVYRPHRGRL